MATDKASNRETFTLFVSGNGSDSAAVQEALNELAFFDDATLLTVEDHIQDLIDELEPQLLLNEDDAPEDSDENMENVYVCDALEKIAEILSEIRLYNKVQRLNPADSAYLSRQLGI